MLVVSALLSVDAHSAPFAYLLTEVSDKYGTTVTKEFLINEDIEACNGVVKDGVFTPNNCNIGDVPVVHRSGNIFIKHSGKYSWCLGELPDSRVRLLSVYGKIADVDYTTAFRLALGEGVCNLQIANNYKLSGTDGSLPLLDKDVKYQWSGAFVRIPKVGDIVTKDCFDIFGDPLARAGDILTDLQVSRLNHFGILPPILDSAGFTEESARDLAVYSSRFFVDLGEASWLLNAIATGQKVTVDMLRKGIPTIPEGGLPWVIRFADLDSSVACHSVTVSQLVGCIAKEVLNTRSRVTMERAMLGALLHDVGKLTLDANVLEAGRKLSPIEYEEIKEHAVAGYKLLSASEDPEVRRTAQTALRHHVKKNNKGYPLGIPHNKLRTIDLVVQFCDIFSALLVQRQYKEALPPMEALRITCDELMKDGSPKVTESCAVAIQDGLIGAVVQMRDGSYGRLEDIVNKSPVGIPVIKLFSTGEVLVGDGTVETEPFRILGR